MSNTSRLTIAAVLVALLSGCASQNPYDNQGQQSSGGMSKTAKYGGLGLSPVRWPGPRSITTTAVRAR